MNYIDDDQVLNNKFVQRLEGMDWGLPAPEEGIQEGYVALDPETGAAALILKWEGDCNDWLLIPISPEIMPMTSRECRSSVASPFDGALELWNGRILERDKLENRFILLLPEGEGRMSELQIATLREGVLSGLTGDPLPDSLERDRGERIRERDSEEFRHQEKEARRWNKLTS